VKYPTVYAEVRKYVVIMIVILQGREVNSERRTAA